MTPTEQILKDLGCTYERRADGVLVVRGNIDLSHKGLTALPDLSAVIVEGHFFCSFNKLTNLAGAPRSVGRRFFCDNNQLTSLTGAPQSLGEDFYCRYNPLTSLEGLPQKFERIFSDWGKFSSIEEIPEDLRLSPEARARLQREAEEKAKAEYQKYLEDTDAGRGLRREMPLPPRFRWKKTGIDFMR